MLSAEATNTNFIVFGLTRPGLKSITYHTQGDHANHYITDVVQKPIQVSESVIIVQRQLSNFSAISWREQVNFQ